jgi:hypothetical protein
MIAQVVNLAGKADLTASSRPYCTNCGMIQRGSARIASGHIITISNIASIGASNISVSRIAARTETPPSNAEINRRSPYGVDDAPYKNRTGCDYKAYAGDATAPTGHGVYK